jgi:zinc/manganese transport system permease protein
MLTAAVRAAAGDPVPRWDLLDDLRQMLAYHFMVNAFWAGTAVALAAALLGWFMVLRRQAFAGHTLSVVAFPGAAAATLAGVAVSWGYFGACAVAGALIAAAGGGRRRGFSEESAVIGVVQAFALAVGYLCVALYQGFLGGINALLFGSFLGITDDQVLVLVVVTGVIVVLLAVFGRQLLFASVDADVAAAVGVPVRLLGAGFLVFLGLAAAEASQITGALLVFALLVMPAASAQRLTAQPVPSLVLSVVLALLVTWFGLGWAFFTDRPVGFTITTLAFGVYVLASVPAVAGALLRPRVRAVTA